MAARLLPLDTNTDIVSVEVEVDGEVLPGSVLLRTIEVIRQANRIPYARLVIADGDPARGLFDHSNGERFLPGNVVTISAGYHGATEAMFTGKVLSQRVFIDSEDSYVEVVCRDPVAAMSVVERNRQFEEVTDADIAETLVGEHGLTADIEATRATHAQLLQYQATDWDFLITRLEHNGQLVAVEDGVVRSFTPNLDGEPILTAAFGSTIIDADIAFDARTQTGGVVAKAWDPASQALAESESSDPGWSGNGDLDAGAMSDATGRELDEVWHGGALAADALQAWADGTHLRHRMASTIGHVRFRGFGGLALGDVIALDGISDRFNGSLLVTGIRHQLADNDWVTDIEIGFPTTRHVERFAISHLPAAGLTPAVSGLQIGVVTELADDPLGEHRVRVKIPVAGMEESGVWARVATPDAGNGRGMVFRPEVDDEVVIGFLHGDGAQPIVLGMLHSSALVPPIEPTADNHQKGYTSREGIKLTFDDETVAVTLETPGGNKLLLSDDEGGIVLEDQNGNKISLTSDGITIESAADLNLTASGDLNAEGVNTNVKASAAFAAEGSASADLTSSGVLTVQGSLVQIN